MSSEGDRLKAFAKNVLQMPEFDPVNDLTLEEKEFLSAIAMSLYSALQQEDNVAGPLVSAVMDRVCHRYARKLKVPPPWMLEGLAKMDAEIEALRKEAAENEKSPGPLTPDDLSGL